MSEKDKLVCQICHQAKDEQDVVMGENLRPSLADFIASQHPAWNPDAPICLQDVGRFRKEYVKRALQDELGELSTLDQEVVDSLQQHELLSANIEDEFARELTFGERLSDRIAEFGGSWTFIIIFGLTLVAWIAFNVWALADRGFDPYPFILLNLILSCLAAIQAPVIMMSKTARKPATACTPRTITK